MIDLPFRNIIPGELSCLYFQFWVEKGNQGLGLIMYSFIFHPFISIESSLVLNQPRMNEIHRNMKRPQSFLTSCSFSSVFFPYVRTTQKPPQSLFSAYFKVFLSFLPFISLLQGKLKREDERRASEDPVSAAPGISAL